MANRCAGLLVGMLLVGCAARQKEVAPPPPTAREYLAHFERGIERTRAQMDAIIASAEKAARGYARGGRIFAAGSQEEFARELIDRNGGLAEIGHPPARMDQIRRGDVILYAARSQFTMNDRLRMTRWREAGAVVIGFAAKAQDDPFFLPADLIDSGDEGLLLADGKLCPTDGAMNLLNAWTWTGEFIAACTRVGKGPPIATAARVAYRSSKDAIAPGELGRHYLDCAEHAMDAIAQSTETTIAPAGSWLMDSDAKLRRMAIASRLYPEHFKDARAPQPFADVRTCENGRAEMAGLTLVLVAQSAPQLAIDAAHLRRSRLIYCSAERARDDRADYILYANPQCAAGDGCVKISGYAAPALPLGSVMQSAVYWSIVAEAQRPVTARK